MKKTLAGLLSLLFIFSFLSALGEGAGEAEYRIVSYTANSQTFGKDMLKMSGMDDTSLKLNPDHTGTFHLMGLDTPITWDDDGNIAQNGVITYTFRKTDETTVEVHMMGVITYTLKSDEGGQTAEAPTAQEISNTAEAPVPQEAAKATEAPGEKPAEAPEEKNTGAQAPAAPYAPGEPVAKGDGVAAEDQILLMMRYCEYCNDRHLPVYYEDLARVAGVEGKDGGNKGPNSMTEYGDRLVFWYINDRAYVYYTFRRTAEEDVWTTRQWLCQNIERSSYEQISEKALLPYLPEPDFENGQTLAFDLVPFMGETTAHVTLRLPRENWHPEASGDSSMSLYHNGNGETFNSPSIEISGNVSLEKIDFYRDKFKDLAEDLPERVIGGVSLKCRRYELSEPTIEYYGKLADGFWLSVKLKSTDGAEGTAADLILKTIDVRFD